MRAFLLLTLPILLEAAAVKTTWGPDGKINKLNGPSGSFNSENWPTMSYLPKTRERWQISVTPGMVVQLSFDSKFALETTPLGSCADWVQIMDGRYASNDICQNKNPMIQRVCGMSAPMPIYSQSNVVLVELCTDVIREDVGFQISFMETMRPTTTTVAPSNFCGRPADQFPPSSIKIVGGKHAAPHSWPWAAALFTGSSSSYQFCGGSLINEGWVMTAGHCFYGQTDMSGYHVKLGADNKGNGFESNEASQQVIAVDKAFVHPQFDPSKLNHDMTLLKLKKKAVINDYVKPVCLASNTDNPATGTPTVIIGWGTTSEGGQDSPTLLQVTIPVYDQKKCHDEYVSMGYNVDETMICAALDQGGVDSCQGDSGGPLMIQKDDGNWYIEGIVSWGRGCAEANYAGVYGRVSALIDWAMGVIDANGMPSD
jgi:V8-like Glu-specific endopeptidase